MSEKPIRHIFLQKLSPKHYFSERMIPDTTDSNRTDPGYRFGSFRFGKFYRYLPILPILTDFNKFNFVELWHKSLRFESHMVIFHGSFCCRNILNNLVKKSIAKTFMWTDLQVVVLGIGYLAILNIDTFCIVYQP